MKTVSVIIPSYNCAPYLETAVQSVLNQTYTFTEVIVVDDGSTDNTKSLCEKLIRENPDRVRYIYQRNLGVSVARNTGIDSAAGDFIAFLDADDEFGPFFFEEGINALAANDIDFVIPAHFCHKIIAEDGTFEIEPRVRSWPSESGQFYRALTESFIGAVALLAKRECFASIHFDPSLVGGEDHDLWLTLTEAGFKAGMIKSETPQFFYAIRKGSAMNAPTVKGRKRYYEGLFLVLKKHQDFAISHDSELRHVLAEKSWRIGMELIRNDRRDGLGYRALMHSQKLEFSPKRIGGLFGAVLRKAKRGVS